MNHTVLRVIEHAGRGRLGRHIEHDERSRAFGMASSPGRLHSVKWERHCDPFDQGDLGSCTGNAMAGAIMTGPLFSRHRVVLTEDDAVKLYERATKLDDIEGDYPPEDTGSSGLAVAKAAVQAGYIRHYRHAFGIDQALAALAAGPIIIGINWYAGFDQPEGKDAELVIDGGIRGGHELVLDELNVEKGLVGGTNSWGVDWGNHGRFTMSFGTFKRLLKERGDVVVPLFH